ncbi:hypothetical protein INT46_001902 [Mucor plumbeus]|uniref:Uncharacterized protein n=1 Tax=Mucor plumbeus TaxID=97098 RepID=A0A8H7RGZ0_9FUNG|nr:hypothetical protein INT46_001902 [Mucor plumbeus]
MLRQCPPNNNNTRNGTNPVFQTAELQRYSELLRNEDRSDTAIKNTTDNNNTTSTFVNRVLEDVSHLIDIIKVPIKHTLCSEFMTKLRDIFLVPDPVDKFNVSRVLNAMNNTWNYKVATNSAWVWNHVQCRIPPANQLQWFIGFAKYHCYRGTNSLEGSVNFNIIRKFSSFNDSIQLANAALTVYRLQHNANASPLVCKSDTVLTKFLLLGWP